jgi:uncharacterized membrane protein
MKTLARRLAAAGMALTLSLLFASPTAAASAASDAQLQAIRQQQAEIAAQQSALDAKIQAETAGSASDDATVAAAQQLPPDEYMRARVLTIEAKGTRTDEIDGTDRITDYGIRILDGKEKGKELTIEVSQTDAKNGNRVLKVGDVIVVVKSYQIDGTASYYLADNYRLPTLEILAGLFFLLAVVFGGVRGFTSVLGLGASVAVILGFIVPKIIAGANPFHVTLLGVFMIAAVSLYLAHGFNRRTTVAFAGTVITLSLSAGVAVLAVSLSRLYGMGSEQALYLQNGDFGDIDLRGLLLGGIMLGVLGVLDDITTAQSAVIEELKRANRNLAFADLYKRGLSVGREHIASLVNTLFLAYAGASLPLFLLFEVYKNSPTWFILNNEIISEEIVRTLVGSVCLILAVPITTALAAAFFARYAPDEHAHGAPPVHHH